MVANLHDNIVFKNIQDGETNLLLQGKKSSDSRQSSLKFTSKERQQNITSVKHSEDHTEIEIDYYAVLAADMPNGLKKEMNSDYPANLFLNSQTTELLNLPI